MEIILLTLEVLLIGSLEFVPLFDNTTFPWYNTHVNINKKYYLIKEDVQ